MLPQNTPGLFKELNVNADRAYACETVYSALLEHVVYVCRRTTHFILVLKKISDCMGGYKITVVLAYSAVCNEVPRPWYSLPGGAKNCPMRNS